MLEDIVNPDPNVRDLVLPVVASILGNIDGVEPADLMLVGAAARDMIHVALGHEHRPLRATHDVDIALALASWRAFDAIDAAYESQHATGIRFNIAGSQTDVLPFGEIERPAGKATPRSRRGDAVDVWGMTEVYRASVNLRLDRTATIKIPTPAGFGVLKLAAWMDRSPAYEYKDADDLAALLFWYRNSKLVEDRLYDARRDGDILIKHDFEVAPATAEVLGRDIAAVLGEELSAQLRTRASSELQPQLLADRVAHANQAYRLGSAEYAQELVDALIHAL